MEVAGCGFLRFRVWIRNRFSSDSNSNLISSPKIQQLWLPIRFRILHCCLRSDPMASLANPLSLPTLRRSVCLPISFLFSLFFVSLRFWMCVALVADNRGRATSIKEVRSFTFSFNFRFSFFFFFWHSHVDYLLFRSDVCFFFRINVHLLLMCISWSDDCEL